MTLIARTATGAALAALLSVPALADDGFGGSFDDGEPAVEATSDAKQPEPDTGAQAASEPATNDGFGGSFGPGTETTTDSGTTTGDTGTADSGTTADTAPEDGSFDPGFAITGSGTGTGDSTETAMPETQPETQPETDQGEQAQAQAITVDPQILSFESRDYGVPPSGNLRNGGMHAPTPTMVPGASVVSTEGLANAMASGLEMIIIDVLGGEYALPGAYMIPEMASAGSYQDRIQQQTGQFLGQVTGQLADYPIILYCSDPQCWLSYNATLRVVAAGYTNVYWYRGGITAWQMAGFPVYPSGY